MRINGNTLAAIGTGFNTIFAGALAAGAAGATWGRVAMETISTGSKEAYPWLGAIRGAREWIGDRVIGDFEANGFELTNKDYENTIAVRANDIRDDKLGLYKPQLEELALTMTEMPDALVWDVLKNGFTRKGYDGKPLFATDHPVANANGKSVPVSNMQDGAAAPWFLIDNTRRVMPVILQWRERPSLVAQDDPRSDRVFMRNEFIYGASMRCVAGPGLWQLAFGSKAALTPENFSSAYTAMSTLKGDRDRPIRPRPRLLVVPPGLREAAIKILKSEKLADNSANPNRDLVELHIEPYLS